MLGVELCRLCFSESNHRPNKDRGILCPVPGPVKSFLCHKQASSLFVIHTGRPVTNRAALTEVVFSWR